ncbi:caspase family protein [Streptomyces sp. NPDC048332]|uniref:caspase family protein n=1 Tax=Streptomyces sp. NPDC048332 TaxID=3154619 RepID=UPI003416F344
MTYKLPNPASSHAVLVGAHEYSNLDNLPSVQNNLVALADAFSDVNVWGMPKGNICTIEQPNTAKDILDAVIDAGRMSTDTLLIYYAGHGLADEYTDELYLALPRTIPFRLDTAFRYECMRRWLTGPEISANRIAVILDCCWSGRALQGGMAAGDALADSAAVPGRCVLAASASTGKALAPPNETYTAFTGVLLEALTEGIPGAPGVLSMETIYSFAHNRLATQSRPLPELGSRGVAGSVYVARNLSKDRISAAPSVTVESSRVRTEWPTGKIPARMGAVVREILFKKYHPYVVDVRVPKNETRREVRNARSYFDLDNVNEELIAAWGYGSGVIGAMSHPHSIAFTTRGIHCRDGGGRIFVPYETFGKCEFRAERSSGYNSQILITGPDVRWSSACAGDQNCLYIFSAINEIRDFLKGGNQ